MSDVIVSLVSAPAVAPAAAKPAKKAAAAKPAAAAKKAAAKPAKPAAAKPAAVAPLRFAVRDSFRPAAGALLFAYTRAWLEVSGLNAGGDISKAHAVTLAGGTAIAYHTGKTGRFVEKAGRVSLAENAAEFFAKRGGEQKNIDTFSAILRTGKPDDTLVKNAAGIVELK